MKKFEWPKIENWEHDHLDRIRNDADDYLCEYYNVDDVHSLSQEQIQQVVDFVDAHKDKNTLMCQGLSDVIMWLYQEQ